MTTRELYLNHAGTSWPKPRVVLEAFEEAMATPPSRWPNRFDAAHQAIAEFFGVRDREQILLTPGCTSALAVGIGDALLTSGQRVLTSQWEHHALQRPLLKLAATGVRLEPIPPEPAGPDSGHAGPLDLHWLEQELGAQDVGLVAITAACNVTGELLPYREVIEIAHRHDVLVMIDAAQIVGWRTLDLPNLGADLVAFGGHKGLQAPWGIGGLYLSERARMECVSATCEMPTVGSGDGKATPRPGYCDVGSVDQFALSGLHAALKLLREQDKEGYLDKGREQVRRIRRSLDQDDRVRIFGPANPNAGMPSLAFMFGELPSGQIASRLKQQGLIVGSGLQCAPAAHQTLGTEGTGLVRLSVGLGQPDEEIDEAIERIRSVLRRSPS